jgi:ABC-type histidine transport system ATPase subunit
MTLKQVFYLRNTKNFQRNLQRKIIFIVYGEIIENTKAKTVVSAPNTSRRLHMYSSIRNINIESTVLYFYMLQKML